MTTSPSDALLSTLVRNRNYISYIAVRFFSQIATQIQSVAIGWQVYELTKDPLALGIVGLATFLPVIVLTLPAGDVADRYPRRIILCLTFGAQALTAGMLLALSLSDNAQAWHFYAIAALFGAARAFSNPAGQSIIPNLIPREHMPAAVAFGSSTMQVSMIAGPAVGGAVFVFGAATAYGAALALFLVTTLAMATIRVAQRIVAEPGVTASARFLAGIRFVWSRPTIFGSITLDLFAVMLGGATALLPVYAHDILVIGPVGLGALRSAPAVGAAVTGIILARFPLQRNAGPVMFAMVALFGAATTVFGFSENFALSFVALVVLGAADMVSVYIRSTMIQLSTPDEMRGRVSAAYMLFISTSNEFGEFRSGVTADLIGVVPAVVVGGVGAIAVTALSIWTFPELRRVDRLADITPENAPRRGAAIAGAAAAS